MIKCSVSRDGDLVEFTYLELVNLSELSLIITEFAWSAGTFLRNYRKKQNFACAEFIGLDVDSGCTLDEALELFKDYRHIIATSKSHQKEKNGIVCDRFRVILFFSEPVTSAGTFENTWHSLYKQFPFIDPACKDASRFFYPSPEIISVNEGGKLIDPVLESPVKPITYNTSVNDCKGTMGLVSRKTLDFLVNGAEPGQWHVALFKAAIDWKEQGGDIGSFIEKAEKITGFLDDHDIYTIEDVFQNRTPKHPPRLPQDDVDTTGASEAPAGAVSSLVVRASDLSIATLEFLDDKHLVQGEPTQFPGYDYLLGGGKRLGELTVTHAEAGSGKNTFWHFLMHLWASKSMPMGYASRELTPETEVIPDFLSLFALENARKVELTESRKKLYTKIIQDLPISFAKGYGYFPIDDLVAWVRELKKEGVQYFWFDHLHYMLEDPEDHKAAAKLIMNMKTLVKEENIHIDLIIQPNKLGDGQRLGLNSIKGGSAMGQAIDNLVILERQKYLGIPHITRLTLDKARSKLCRQGSIYLQYDPTTMNFIQVELDEIKQQTSYNEDQEENMELISKKLSYNLMS